MAKPDRGHELLAACFGDDRGAQLVYADWLEEQGYAFANVVRAKSDAAANKRVDLDWFGDAVDWVNRRDTTFERGMIHQIYGATNKYASKADQAALLPVVSRFGVRMTMLRGPSPKLARAETLAWTGALRWLDSQLDDTRASALARSPHLAHGRLHQLAFEKLRVGNAGLAAFARSPAFARVTSFEIAAPVHLGDFANHAVQEVLEALPLERLVLIGPISAPVHELAAQPVFAKLAHFTMTGARSREIAQLLGAEHVTGLRSLRVGAYEAIHDEELEPLFSNPALHALERVDIDSTRFHVSPAMQRRLRARFG